MAVGQLVLLPAVSVVGGRDLLAVGRLIATGLGFGVGGGALRFRWWVGGCDLFAVGWLMPICEPVAIWMVWGRH